MKTLTYQKPIVIAEIGGNHKGDFDLAKEKGFLRRAGSEIPETH
jgi:sialic acid synthase SpsE